jgi:hypothetical protein
MPRRENDQTAHAEFLCPTNVMVFGHVTRFHDLKDHASLLVGRKVSLQNAVLHGIVPAHLEDKFVFSG